MPTFIYTSESLNCHLHLPSSPILSYHHPYRPILTSNSTTSYFYFILTQQPIYKFEYHGSQHWQHIRSTWRAFKIPNAQAN